MVRPGKVGRRPAAIASQRVEMTGEKREAWRNATCCRIVEVGRTEFAVRGSGVGGEVSAWGD